MMLGVVEGGSRHFFVSLSMVVFLIVCGSRMVESGTFRAIEVKRPA